MVSQGSFCDSDYVPDCMPDACEDEDAMSLIKLRREVDDFPILISSTTLEEKESYEDINGFSSPEFGVGIYDKTVPEHTVPSSSGGIPLQEGMVEDCSTDEEGGYFVSDRDAIERDSIHRVAKAAFETNKNDREELIRLKLKMMEVQRFLTKRGLSLAECEKETLLGDSKFNAGLSSSQRFVSGRDEFGLPKFTGGTSGGMGENRKDAKVDSSRNADNLFDAMPIRDKVGDMAFPPLPKSHSPVSKAHEDEVVLKNSWAKVVRDPPPSSNNVSFKYCPRPAGTSVVSPPIEVLREGNDKFKNCIVGTFSKGVKSFSLVTSAARSAWEHRGLTNVFQKDTHVFIFKFNSMEERNKVLAWGTWYVGNQPMLLKAWGSKFEATKVDTMPLWVKFSKVPDCYWTTEGLSWLGSAIGVPLCADALTSKLEVLPFAKMCVNYKIGDALPDKIEVQSLDPSSGEMTIAEVLVHYPSKPLVCTGCHSLGHPISACPTTIRRWVVKRKQEDHTVQQEPSDKTPTCDTEQKEDTMADMAPAPPKDPAGSPTIPTVATSSIIDDSPSPVLVFKNLRKVDEIDAKRASQVSQEFLLSKSQRKKQKKALKGGGSSSSLSFST